MHLSKRDDNTEQCGVVWCGVWYGQCTGGKGESWVIQSGEVKALGKP